VPFETVSTYTERPHLSEELGVKLRKRHGGAGLAYAAAVTGLGGTGKTQLVLRYIKEHEKDYDTVLWIDVRSEKTARSSYERCCRTAGLPIEAATGDVPLQDTPVVQAMLSWLRSKGEDKRWLAVVDNADDLSWDVSGIVPTGKAGTVIVTSQDAQAARLLGGRTPTVRVDAMEPEEAVRLVLNYFDESVYRGDACWGLAKEITECLNRLALAMDLAGARIGADVENGNEIAVALRQYLADYRHHQDKLLRDEEFAPTTAYKKTVWTVWETTLSSLRKAEQLQSDICPVQLLGFFTLLNGAHIQDELFQLATLGLQKSRHSLSADLPSWMHSLLADWEGDEWDGFSYRATLRCLLRYGLVRPSNGRWKGVTVHSLVQWRAREEIDQDKYWQWYFIFTKLVCLTFAEGEGNVHFRRHALLHLPSNEALLSRSTDLADDWLWHLLEVVAKVLREEGRWNDAAELGSKVLEARSRALGEEHPDTIAAMVNLAATYGYQGKLKEGEALQVKVMQAMSSIHGEEHPYTTDAKANLAATLCLQRRLKEAEMLQVEVLERRSRELGEEHPCTLDAINNLASTYCKQGQLKKAEELDVRLVEASIKVLGKEHPRTLIAMGNLAATNSFQGRYKRAEKLGIMIVEASSRVLGENHFDTLDAMANLAMTYCTQGRRKKSEKLLSKVIDARLRAFGGEHPQTLTDMANHAHVISDLSQDVSLYKLKRRSAAASSKAPGDNCPDPTSCHEQKATWPGDGGSDCEDGDWESDDS
jgi:tetratricopeptide (TPR) repeat protein